MKSYKFFVALAFFCASTFAHAVPKQISKEQADQLASEYAKEKFIKTSSPTQFFLNEVQECPTQDLKSCVKVVCDKTKDCVFDSNLKEIAQACRGASGDCVDVLCSKTNDCFFKSSALALVESCKASNGACTRIGCEKTGDCAFSSNAKEIAKACMGVYDDQCVSFACERSGSCVFKSSFIAIARSCAGY